MATMEAVRWGQQHLINADLAGDEVANVVWACVARTSSEAQSQGHRVAGDPFVELSVHTFDFERSLGIEVPENAVVLTVVLTVDA
jgi:hypothetical protein